MSFGRANSIAPVLLETAPGLLDSNRASRRCYHCGAACADQTWQREGKHFCCRGCLAVFELVTENGLGEFYRLSPQAGVRAPSASDEQFRFLDKPGVREKLADFLAI